MADNATTVATGPVDATAPVTVEEPTQPTNGEAPIIQEDEDAAGKQATTEVTAPDGATTEAAEGPSADATDATPASGKKEKRKSTSGVPEHKSKKLNKKKSMPSLNLECKPGQHYWARLKGYPPWPAIICDEQMLPESLLASRPVSTAGPDGTLRADFQEGGKNAKERTFPIMFLSTNEFSWMINTSLTPLDPEECKNKPTAKMTKALQKAYVLASEDHNLTYYKDILKQWQEEEKNIAEEMAQQEAELEREAAEKAEKEAKDAAEPGDDDGKEKKKKKARKSKAADEDVEMEDAEAPKSSKKRKKEAESDAEGAKPKKTPKVTKLNAPKTPNGEASAKKPASKPKKKVSAPKAEEVEEEQKPQMSEAEKLAQREKAVLYLRHRLQKGFLSRDSAPQETEMHTMAEFFTQLENYENLEPSIIRITKIHKVLKAIVKLASIPKDAEYNFKKRSSAMLDQWNKRMESDGDAGDAAPASAVEPKSADAEQPELVTNGAATAEEAKQVAEDKTDIEAKEIATESEVQGKAEEPHGEVENGVAAKSEESTTALTTEEPPEIPVEKTDFGNEAQDEAADGDVSMQTAPEEASADTVTAEAT